MDDESKRKIGLQYKADGEFWMSFFTDFFREFEEVSICTMGPDFDLDGQVDQALTLTLQGSWIPNVNAGGCRNDMALFATNPKYKITIGQEINQVIIGLAQKKVPGIKLHQIGFTIYESNHQEFYDVDFFRSNKAFGTSGSYINYREIFGRYSMPRGTYIVIPATFAPNTSADFLLRVYSQEKITLEPIT